MSSRTYRRATAVALLAGSLGLAPLTAQAAPPPHPAGGSGRGTAASPSLFGSFWSLLVHLWAGDHHGGDDDNYDGTGGHSSHHPHTDEGPGICPHGR